MKYVFDTIKLKTPKIEEQFQFYTEKLGFQVIEKTDQSFSIKCGLTILEFQKYDNNAVYHFAFNIPENQIEDSIAWVRKYTEILPFEENEIVDFKNWNAHSCYFLDEAGNILEFIARHNLKNSSNDQFNSNSIMEISEIGIVNSDLKDFYKRASKELNYQIFSGNSEYFYALGNENALLICVPPERAWMPTDDVLSKVWPLEIIFKNECGEKKKLIFKRDNYIFIE